MTKFESNQLTDSTVMLIYLERAHIYLKPPYQRAGEVWNLYKNQLLIDSLINGFDIPKLYFHEYEKAEMHEGKLCKYAIIDGKQRLLAMWGFMNGEFPLGDEIEYLKDPKVKLGGLTYKDLSEKHQTIQARLTGRPLTIISIRTDDTDVIEDLFSRLNEAVPLNAAEKRNAFGGPLSKIIRRLVKTGFFKKLRIPTTRYRHYDLACKFLYLEYQKGPAETKKIRLDNFVKEFANSKLSEKARDLERAVAKTLDRMSGVFVDNDPLLRSPGMVTAYYLLSRGHRLHRSAADQFEKELRKNRKVAEKDFGKAKEDLLEFDRLNQTPNDKSAIEYRIKVLKKYVLR